MNTQDAKAALSTALGRYRGQSYGQLQRLLSTQDTFELTGPSGTTYQLEVEAVWDDHAGGNLRVMAYIDDGGWRSLAPLTADFILTPSGTLLDE